MNTGSRRRAARRRGRTFVKGGALGLMSGLAAASAITASTSFSTSFSNAPFVKPISFAFISGGGGVPLSSFTSSILTSSPATAAAGGAGEALAFSFSRASLARRPRFFSAAAIARSATSFSSYSCVQQ